MHVRYRIERTTVILSATAPMHADGEDSRNHARVRCRGIIHVHQSKIPAPVGRTRQQHSSSTPAVHQSEIEGRRRPHQEQLRFPGHDRPTEEADIAAKGIKFFSEIDQSKLAADAGIKLNPSTLLVFGNPPLGTQFMTSNPNAGPRLAGAAPGHAGQRRRGVDGLQRLRLDRRASRHRQPRRSVQDGVDGDRVDHIEREGLDADERDAGSRIAHRYRVQSNPAFPSRTRPLHHPHHCTARTSRQRNRGDQDVHSSTPTAAGFVRSLPSRSSLHRLCGQRTGRRMPRRQEQAERSRGGRSCGRSGVTDTTLGAIDLGKEMAKIKGRELRFRKMVIQPGGIVPWHSHDDRPALIYVERGRDHRIRQQLRGADPSQDRRNPPRNPGHVALVEEPQRQPGGRCSSAMSGAIRTTTICDGCAFPSLRRIVTPRIPRTGRHSFGSRFLRFRLGDAQFIERGYRQRPENTGKFEGDRL